MEELYRENIIDHYSHPRNKEELGDFDFKHREDNPLCGDEITLYLKYSEGKVRSATFMGDGCAISQASISMFTEKLIGKSRDELEALSENDIFSLLGIRISPGRLKCALLPLRTLKKGLEGISC